MGNMIYSKEALSGLIRSDKSKLLDEELAGLKTDRYLRIAFAVLIYLGVMAYIGFVIHLIYKHGEFKALYIILCKCRIRDSEMSLVFSLLLNL